MDYTDAPKVVLQIYKEHKINSFSPTFIVSCMSLAAAAHACLSWSKTFTVTRCEYTLNTKFNFNHQFLGYLEGPRV